MVETMKPPKNIRQIGMPSEKIRIYLEDYVYTYLHAVEDGEQTKKNPAILVGSSQEVQGVRYIYVSGAITMAHPQQENGRIIISETVWGEIYQELKRSFANCSIVGWYYPEGEDCAEYFHEIERAHRVYFPGGDKVLYLNNRNEREDYFYICGNGIFEKQKGYCIYYEKNPQMQEYMIMQKASKKIAEDREENIAKQEIEDKAVLRYREIVAQQIKKEAAREKIRGVVLSAMAVVFICTLGIFMYASYGKVEQLENVVNTLTNILGMKQEEQQEEIPVIRTEKPDQKKEVPQLQQEKDSKTQELKPEKENKEGKDGEDNSEKSDSEKTGSKKGEQNRDQAGTSKDEETSIYLTQGYYVVQKGDSLEEISKKIYQTTDMIENICNKNNIEDVNEIYEGQKLMLP